ncbi:MAG: DNA-packaging protein, partial [Pseudomonadota bacterium]
MNLSGGALKAFNAKWGSYARKDQMAPEGDWRVWLFLGGRGAGKTRAGAEWVRARALGEWPEGAPPARRIALVGPTLHDVRQV